MEQGHPVLWQHQICLPLDGEHKRIGDTVEWLFEEAFSEHSARQVVMNKLCEIIIQLLRHVMASNSTESGLLAGLSHPQLSKAIDAIHGEPERSWSLNELAEIAAMSRSRFAEQFKETVGQTPGDYQTGWRIDIAKRLLKKEKTGGWVANEMGYDSASALARVFRKKTGMSPREWMASIS